MEEYGDIHGNPKRSAGHGRIYQWLRSRNGNCRLGLLFVAVILSLVFVSLFFTPYDPDAMNAGLKLDGPSLSHPFGTDQFGRDILSRVMEGTRTTCLIALITVAAGGGIGTILGALTGYFGGWLDEILMRVNDMIAAFPSILLALVLISVIGTGKYNIVAALSIIFIPSFARMVRGEVAVQKERDYVKNARVMGVSHLRIIFVHILPNILPVLLSAITIGFNNAVLAEAGMSFLGLGVQPPDSSLGRMLSEAQGFLLNAPWYGIFPGLILVITVLGFGLISENSRDK